jgi:hypothetical protein
MEKNNVLNIVDLVEKNKITKLNGNYQSKMIEKIKNNFNSYEQQLFLASFYCYLQYDSKNDFIIDLDNIWKWLGFSQKMTAKRVLEKNFLIEKDYKFLPYQVVKQKVNEEKAGSGGHNKETFMLNIDTFKKFCLKACTKKADEIHEYFIKLENMMFEITIEESEELKKQLLTVENKNEELKELEEKIIKESNDLKLELQQKNKEYENNLKNEKILERQKILLNEYSNIGNIIYIIKVKTFENKEYIIKIGESRKGILDRYNEHKTKYEECLLLDCFLVQRSKDFESFLHNHEQIRGNRVNNLKSHEKELELFLIGKNLSYQILLNIINNNIKYFNDSYADIKKLKLEIEQLKLMKDTKNEHSLTQELFQIIKNLSCKIDNLENNNKEILNKLNSMQTKTTTNFNEPLVTLGPRLQKINPETLQIITVYESVSECMKENHFIKRPSINKAVIENTIYHGFRWLFVDRELNPNVIHKIIETKPLQKNQNLGYIAKLNKDKTEIINIYLDRKTASNLNNCNSDASLDIPVKKGKIYNGFYYMLYDKCDLDLINNFQEYKNQSKEPILYKNGVGQFDKTNNLIREFICKYDVIKLLKISDKTLSKAIDNNILYNDYYFRYIGSKLSI